MAKSKESWNKKEMENLRKKKKDDKAKRKLAKKENEKESGKKSFEDMIAYVDENGQLTNEPPDLAKKKTVISADSIVISTARRTADEEAPSDYTGKVAFFNTSKGYGFIKGSTGDSYFVHINDLITPITENDNVTFKVESSPRGMKAVEVKLYVAEKPVAEKPAVVEKPTEEKPTDTTPTA